MLFVFQDEMMVKRLRQHLHWNWRRVVLNAVAPSRQLAALLTFLLQTTEGTQLSTCKSNDQQY